MENNANQLNSMLCKRNCGFFGNAACDGYCSKCYKDHVKRQNSGSAAGRVTPTSISHSESSQSSSSSSSTTTTVTETAISETTAQQVVPQQQAGATASMPIPIPAKQQQQQQQAVSSESMICESAPAYTSSQTIQQQQQQQGGAGGEDPSTLKSVESGSSLASSNDLSTSLNTSEKKKRTRCCVDTCKRKVGLTGFDCRCGGLYCWEHRYSDKHDCKFDYKELGQDQIRKNNPIVVGEKIQKI